MPWFDVTIESQNPKRLGSFCAAPSPPRGSRAIFRSRLHATMGTRAAIDEDLPRVIALLDAVGLPTAGLIDAFPGGYVVAMRDMQVVACAGLEIHGSSGLLRSVATAREARGLGVGRDLVAERVEAARRAHLDAVYLLTTTAADYFARLGFIPADRAAVPSALAASSEFARICPASASCLVRMLTGRPSAQQPGSRG